VAAVGALEAGEAGGEVAAAEEGLDGGDGGGIDRAEGKPVEFSVVGEEGVPAVVDDLPEGLARGRGVGRWQAQIVFIGAIFCEEQDCW